VYEAQQRGDRFISVWGDGTSTREFVYSEDAARGIVMASEAYNESEPINIGTGLEISIKDLIHLICELMGYDGEIIWETDKPNGQPRRCLDVERAKQAFGFTAQVDFRDGLNKTIAWYRHQAA
jgi:GDP-L-fucose synthase